MAAQRTAEQIHWSEESAKKSTALWGCWKCGFEDSYVRDVDKDSEHVRVRRRMCTRCGSMWETEERRISAGSFFARAETRRMAHFRKSRYVVLTCLVCKDAYMAGLYKEHTESSEAHMARVAAKQRKIQERERNYKRVWARAQRRIARAMAGTAVCPRCGERYDLSLRNPARTHRGTSPVHRQIVKEEGYARRNRLRYNRPQRKAA